MEFREKKKVIIIDDQEEIRELVSVSLPDSEFETFQASNGLDGIRMAKDLRPDVILLDIMMPKFDGFQTCNVLKRNSLTKDIPVIFLTAKKSADDVVAAHKMGGEDYIVKPFSPGKLLERIRKLLPEGKSEAKPARTINEQEGVGSTLSAAEKGEKSKDKPLIEFERHADVLAITIADDSIDMKNLEHFQDAFTYCINQGIYKIAIDLSHVKRMDGAGLAFLISTNEALKNCGGELRITHPKKELNSRFSFVRLNLLFRAYSGLQEVIESFQGPLKEEAEAPKKEDLNLCMACTFVNPPKFRHCGYCGSNLVLGRGDSILENLRHSISSKVFSEARTDDIEQLNLRRNIQADDPGIPSEFEVEVQADNLNLRYKSNHTDDADFQEKKRIAITAPLVSGQLLPLRHGMPVYLLNKQIGARSLFETRIEEIDPQRKMLLVHYSEDAKNLHTRKNFSISPEAPLPVIFVIPSTESTGKFYKGNIVVISRVGLLVFSEQDIPVNQCLALNFVLPEGPEISTPLVIAQKSEENFTYEIEFVVTDDSERAAIVQYMYKRQIEIRKTIQNKNGSIAY